MPDELLPVQFVSRLGIEYRHASLQARGTVVGAIGKEGLKRGSRV
jgi:hypothetical protein